MLRHLPRLLAIWRIAARYRLDTLLPPSPFLLARLLLLAFRLHPAWWLRHPKADSPERVRLACEELGPVFIKFGQLIATRRDLLAPEMLDELIKLQDDVPPFEVALAKRIVEAELDRPLVSLFAEFSEQPLAAASIAQVHTARLFDGREVVVKILRPGISDAIVQDLSMLQDAARWLERNIPDTQLFHPLKVVQDYEETLLGECDLCKEAANAIQLRKNFLNSPLLYVPEVVPEMSTSQVLISERIYGVPINDDEAIAEAGVNRKRLAENGLTIFFTQLFRDNFFHADMHPGNVFVDLRNPENPCYIALDCAIIGSLTNEDQLAVARLGLALTNHDYGQIVQIANGASWIPPGTPLRPLEQAVRRLLEPVLSKSIDQVNFAPTLLGLLDMARLYRLEIPTQFVLLLKTLVHVEGLGRGLYPSLDIWTLSRPLLTSWLNQQIGPAALARKVSESLPLLLTNLPELPMLVHDALLQTRATTQLQQTQLQEIRQLRQSLIRQRRSDIWTLSVGAAALALAIVNAGALPRLPVGSWALGGVAAVLLLSRILPRRGY